MAGGSLLPVAPRVRACITALALALPLSAHTAPADAQAPVAAHWLDALETRLVGLSGAALEVRRSADPTPDGSAPPLVPPLITSARFIFYAPLAALWELDATTDPARAGVLASATLRREGAGDAAVVQVLWDDGAVTGITRPRAAPDFIVHVPRHLLATAHDRLLTRPLTRPLAGLPVGTRFDPDGIVRPPETADTSLTPGPVILWHSRGDHVLIHLADGTSVALGLDEIIAAMAPPATGKPIPAAETPGETPDE